jgi:hypothetical protein
LAVRDWCVSRIGSGQVREQQDEENEEGSFHGRVIE